MKIARRRLLAGGEGAGLDAPDELHDALVLQEHLVVEQPAHLLGQLADGALGLLDGGQPVLVQVRHGVEVVRVGEGLDLGGALEEFLQSSSGIPAT